MAAGIALTRPLSLRDPSPYATNYELIPEVIRPDAVGSERPVVHAAEVIDTAEELKYDNQRTTGDIVRLKLALARAALKRPGSATRNEDVGNAAPTTLWQ